MFHMAYEKIFLILATISIVLAIGLYLYTKEFSILFFGLLLAGMANGRFSNRLARLRILRDPEGTRQEKIKLAKKWLTGVESKSDRFATNYITPGIIFLGLIIALLKRSMSIFYFILLLIVIDAIDRIIIGRMDKYANLVIEEGTELPTNEEKDKREE